MPGPQQNPSDFNDRNKNIRGKGTWGMPIKDVASQEMSLDRSPETTMGSAGQGVSTGDTGGPAGNPIGGATVGETEEDLRAKDSRKGD